MPRGGENPSGHGVVEAGGNPRGVDSRGGFVEDCGSDNGTSVDGTKILGRTELSEGSLLAFGSVEYVFSTKGPDSGSADTIFCTQCGRDLRRTSKFCPACGTKVGA